MKRFVIYATALLLAFTGCASLQKDILISAEDTANSERVQELENQLATLDGLYMLNGQKLSKDDNAQAEFLRMEIDRELQQPHMDKVVESRLLAMKGRCMLMQAKKSDALKCCKTAKSKYENDVQLLILQRRLGLITDINTYRVKLDSEVLTIEEALEHYEKGEYGIASGLFDLIFVNPETIYREPYAAVRQKAWDLRNVDSVNAAVNWNENSLTVMQMMTIANSKQGLLDYYTAGKKYEGKKLYQFLSKAGLMNSVSGTSSETSEKTEVTRAISARFLWNLYTAKNSINPSKYSTKYKSRTNAKSPVADVGLESPDFDAILGTVENEIMTLSDGKNFEPNKVFSAAEFDSCINKLK